MIGDGSPDDLRVDRVEVLRDIRGLRLGRYRGRRVTVTCSRLEAAAYREVVDLALGLAGSRRVLWRDARGRECRASSAPAAFLRLAKDAVWRGPRSYLEHRRTLARIRAAGTDPLPPRHRASGRAGELRRCLYLRADHDFDLRAGGSLAHIAGVVSGLRKLGRRVRVVSTDRLPGLPDEEDFHEIVPRYDPVRNVGSLALLEYNRQLLRSVEGHWEAWYPDFVYHRYTLFGYAAAAIRARRRIPYVCEYNGSMVWVARHWDDRPMLLDGMAEEIEQLNLEVADLVVVVSRVLAREVEERGVPPERILVNPNGVDPGRYSPEVSGRPVRERYGLEGALVVGFIGTFGPWHGAEVLAEAAGRLLNGPDLPAGPHDRLRFLLIGDGVRMEEVRARILEHGIGDSVILTGTVPQEEGPRHLAACDVLASPHVPNPDGSEFFGSPTKIFEYMATGRGIVASDLAQIGEVLDHGETAWLVPPGDPDALAAGIRRLAADRDLRERLGAAARRRALERHSWEAHTRRIVDALADRTTNRAARSAGTTGAS